MKHIGIGLKPIAYTPEAYAYAKYLREHGLEVELVSEGTLNPRNDINVYFMGMRPGHRNTSSSGAEIHDYASLSTPPLARVKDLMKRHINLRPAGRIFLNNTVQQCTGFADHIPWILRDMGVERELYQTPNQHTLFDLVYCGSIVGRPGLVPHLQFAARQGFRILIIGSITDALRKTLSDAGSVECVGRVNREELPALYRECYAGVSYCPNIYPYKLLTITKVLEYMAAGLKIVCNETDWLNQFCAAHQLRFVRWSELSRQELDKASVCPRTISESFEWNALLDRSHFLSFIVNLKC